MLKLLKGKKKKKLKNQQKNMCTQRRNIREI